MYHMPRVVPTALTQSFGPSLHAVLAQCPLHSVLLSSHGFLPRLIADADRPDHDACSFVDTAGGMLEILPNTVAHKYLGRHVCGRPQLRGEIELNHRIAQAWGKFHQHRQVLLNRNVPIHLRLKLFDSTVSPTMLYGMAVLPLTAAQLQRLGAVQRRMLRNITGRVRIADEPWDETMRRMKHRVERALGQHSVQGWPERLC